MHDSGERQQFSTGAVRDTAGDKPRLELISPFALRRLGNWLAAGAAKYAARNWEAGIPTTRCLASLLRHAEAYLAGESDEDHMAAVMCNSMFIIHYEEMIRRGVLPDSLDDRPNYNPEPTNEPSTTGRPACHCRAAGVSETEEEGPSDTAGKNQAPPAIPKRTPEQLLPRPWAR